MKKARIPKKFNKYFWDIDISKLDIDKRSNYVTERLLELGDIDALLWLKNTYGDNALKEVVRSSRRLGRKSANYYSLYFSIPKAEILCLREDFQNKRRGIWKP